MPTDWGEVKVVRRDDGSFEMSLELPDELGEGPSGSSGSSGSTLSSWSSESSLSSESSTSLGPSAPRAGRTRVEVVAMPPVQRGGIVVVTVPRSYTPGEFERIREAVQAAVEDGGATAVFLPEGVSLSSLGPEELWAMGLGVVNRDGDVEGAEAELEAMEDDGEAT